MKKSDIRKAFKQIGYKCSLKSHPMIADAVSLSFIAPNGYTNKGGTVFGANTWQEHQQAFELCNKFKGEVLETGEKIV